jgi:hypothetical protein
MLIEQPPPRQARAKDSGRFRLTWDLDEVSLLRQAAAWVALAVTLAVAVALLVGA